MGKKKGQSTVDGESSPELHPFAWAEVAIAKSRGLLRRYDFFKSALQDANRSLQQNGVAILRGHSNTPGELDRGWRDLQEHYEQRPPSWFECIEDIKQANASVAEGLRKIPGPEWIASTAIEAVELWAEELKETIPGVMVWLPDAAPNWNYGPFATPAGLENLEWLLEAAVYVDERIKPCTGDFFDQLAALIDQEEARFNNYVDEMEYRQRDLALRERQLSRHESKVVRPPKKHASPARTSKNSALVNFARKRLDSGDSYKNIAALWNRDNPGADATEESVRKAVKRAAGD